MLPDELKAWNESINRSLEYAAELRQRAANGETKSETCANCGRVETVPVGTPFQIVCWWKGQEVWCKFCAEDKNDNRKRRPFEWLFGR